MTPEEYLKERERITREFTERAKAELAAFEADPSAYTVKEAMAIVDIDRAIALYKAGKLKDSFNQ